MCKIMTVIDKVQAYAHNSKITMYIVGVGKAKKGAEGRKGGGPRKKSITKSVRVGLQFRVGRIRHYLKKGRYAHRVVSGTIVIKPLPTPPSTIPRWKNRFPDVLKNHLESLQN